jgi:hypothetical protein
MPGWKEAHSLASQALSHAIVGATMATTRDSGADEEAEKAFECLQRRFYNSGLLFQYSTFFFLKYSIEAIHASYKKNIDLLDSWDEERVKFC